MTAVDVNQNFCAVKDLGVLSLAKTDSLMHKLTHLRSDDVIPDVVLFLAHSPTLTVGARDLEHSDLLRPISYFKSRGIDFVQTVRGGGLTYHWPGQLVCYPILKLKPHEQNLSKYMYRLEEVGLRTLRGFGIKASRKRNVTAQIGLWLGNNKIASMGIHVSKWVTSYGFAMNIGGEKEPADYIRPCGLEGVRLITVNEVIGYEPSRARVKAKLMNHFEQVFEREIHSLDNKNMAMMNDQDFSLLHGLQKIA